MAADTMEAVAPHPDAEGRMMFWQGAGVNVPAGLTIEAALTAAGLDWQVEAKPIYRRVGKNGKTSDFKVIDGRRELTRSDTGAGLAVVSDRYVPLQNADLLAFADDYRREAGAVITAAGTLAKGKQIFFTAKLPETVALAGVDPTDFYLLGKAGHDGRAGQQVCLTSVRLACTNAINAALRAARSSWSIPHLSTCEARAAQVRQSLGLIDEYVAALETETTDLMATRISDKRAREVFANLLPMSARAAGRLDGLMDVYHDDPTVNGYAGTAYGVVQAVTAWDQHHRGSRSGEARMLRTVASSAKSLADRALEMVR